MATITSAQAGNFTSGSTWTGGVAPGAADIAVAAHVVTIDADVTVTEFQQSGTGYFDLPGGRTITGTVTGNAGTYTSGGTVKCTAAVNTVATINGAVNGSTTTTASTCAVVMAGVGQLTINGAATGGSGNVTGNKAAVYMNVNGRIDVVRSAGVTAVAGGGGNSSLGVFVDSAASSGTLNVTGNILSGSGSGAYGLYATAAATVTVTGNIAAGSGSGAYGLYATAAATVTVTGNIAAGSSSSAYGMYVNSTAIVTITGNVTGSGTFGLFAAAAATVTVIGNITGGNGSNGYGLYATAASTITVTGNITGGSSSGCYGLYATAAATITVTGDITGGSNATAYGLYAGGASTSSAIVNVYGTINAGTALLAYGILSSGDYQPINTWSGGVTLSGNIVDALNGTRAVRATLFRILPTANKSIQFANGNDFPNTRVSYLSADQKTADPAPSNVRYGVSYANNSFIGELRVPAPSLVAYGVLTDNTTGTATLNIGKVADVIGTQIASALSS